MKHLSIITLILSINSIASATGWSTGTIPVNFQASEQVDSQTKRSGDNIIWSGVDGGGLALNNAALDLSGNDPVFAQDILSAYNPLVTENLIKESPNMLGNVDALLKLSAGVSFLEKTNYVDADKAIKAISKDSSYLENFREVKLEDIYQAY